MQRVSPGRRKVVFAALTCKVDRRVSGGGGSGRGTRTDGAAKLVHDNNLGNLKTRRDLFEEETQVNGFALVRMEGQISADDGTGKRDGNCRLTAIERNGSLCPESGSKAA